MQFELFGAGANAASITARQKFAFLPASLVRFGRDDPSDVQFVSRQVSTNTGGPSLPPGLTALTATVMADPDWTDTSVTAPLPQLPQLAALRRLHLCFRLSADGPETRGHAVLPDLPLGLTHLTIGVTQDRKGFSMAEPWLFGQVLRRE